MTTNIEAISQMLYNKRKLTVPNDWLEACVEWINGENEVDISLPLIKYER